MELIETPIESNVVYNGIIVTVRLDRAALPNGRIVSREVADHSGGVAVLPLHDDGTVTVVRQFRYPFLRVLTEIPAGKLEPGEDPLAAGLRELSEETGYTADEVISLGTIYPSPGYCGEILHLYLARGLHSGACHPDEDEYLTVERVPLEALVAQALDGTLQDAKTITAVLKTRLLIDKEGAVCPSEC